MANINNNSGIVSIGDNNTINQNITTTNNDLKEILELFLDEANIVLKALPKEEQKEFKEDVETFIKKAEENTSDKYFNLSKEGILKATKTVGEVGIKLATYIPKVLQLLS